MLKIGKSDFQNLCKLLFLVFTYFCKSLKIRAPATSRTQKALRTETETETENCNMPRTRTELHKCEKTRKSLKIQVANLRMVRDTLKSSLRYCREYPDLCDPQNLISDALHDIRCVIGSVHAASTQFDDLYVGLLRKKFLLAMKEGDIIKMSEVICKDKSVVRDICKRFSASELENFPSNSVFYVASLRFIGVIVLWKLVVRTKSPEYVKAYVRAYGDPRLHLPPIHEWIAGVSEDYVSRNLEFCNAVGEHAARVDKNIP